MDNVPRFHHPSVITTAGLPLQLARTNVSVLEIGPGPKSVLGYLSGHLRQKVSRYSAFEPNRLFATRVREWLCSTSDGESPFPGLKSQPEIHQAPFVLNNNSTSLCMSDNDQKFDVILFFHSMYGINPKASFIEQALGMLVERHEGGMVIVFHRSGTLHLNGLMSHRTASFPSGTVSVANEDKVLGGFSPFIAGFVMQDVEADEEMRAEWRKVCRRSGRRKEDQPDHLLLSSPNVMVAFTQHANKLPELAA